MLDDNRDNQEEEEAQEAMLTTGKMKTLLTKVW